MAADATLRLVLLGIDKSASKSLKGVGDQAAKTDSKLGKLGKFGKGAALGLAAGLAGAGIAALDFGKDSLEAYAGAQKEQAKLEDAYKRFPKLADTNIDALRGINEAIQRKVGADADDLAGAQATLAQYDLTGKQIGELTPLLVDYATKTGKDLPAASKDLGKALMGNKKAMKDLGIDFKSTGDRTKDFETIVGHLEKKVGGYADSIPEIEKKNKILAASWGDIQEQVGEKLQPVMIGLLDAGLGIMDWLEANPAVVEGVISAFGLLTGMLSGLWDLIRKYVAPGLAWFIDFAIVPMVKGIAGMLDGLGNVPGFGWAKDASKEMLKVADSIDSVTDGLAALANDPKPKVGVDRRTIDESLRKTAELDKEIKDLRDKKVVAKAAKDDKELKELQRQLKAAVKERYRIGIAAIVRVGGDRGIRSTFSNNGTVKFNAFARGTMSAPAGWAWTGEGGPELLKLPAGSRVKSNDESMRAAGRAGVQVNIDLRGSVGIDDRKLERVVRKAVSTVNLDYRGSN